MKLSKSDLKRLILEEMGSVVKTMTEVGELSDESKQNSPEHQRRPHKQQLAPQESMPPPPRKVKRLLR